jgi:hypothetical protein
MSLQIGAEYHRNHGELAKIRDLTNKSSFLGLSTIISFTIAPSSEGLLLIVVGMKFG